METQCPACKRRPMLQGNGMPDMCEVCTLTGALGRVLAASKGWSADTSSAATLLNDALSYGFEVADALGIDIATYR